MEVVRLPVGGEEKSKRPRGQAREFASCRRVVVW